MLNRNVIYTVGSKLKITKSIDGGQSWVPYDNFNFSNSLYDITCIGSDTCFACGDIAKIVKTNDGGENWAGQEVLLNNNLYVLSFINSKYGFAGGQNGALLKTTDGGDNWKILKSHLSNNIISIHFENRLTVYAISSAGKISKSIDGGESWLIINSDDVNFYPKNRIYFKDSTTIFALQEENILRYNLKQVNTSSIESKKSNCVFIYPNPV